MAQVGIVRIAGEYLREYAIEPGDRLIVICLRFGQKDWRAVYNHSANVNFRNRFPDPNQIDVVNPVNLFIPLVGARTSGKKKRGRPAGDYVVVRISYEDGSPYANRKVRLLGPGLPLNGMEATASADGDVIEPNAAPGSWFVVSATVSLTPATQLGEEIASREVPRGPPLPILADPLPLAPNAVAEVVARKLIVLRCPMCWTRFAVTIQSPSGSAYTCPKDGFDWTSIVAAIDVAEPTFLSASLPRQVPSATPYSLVGRGVEPSLLPTQYGEARVYWDESRFLRPNGADYGLWSIDATGVVSTATVIGRSTWGAAAPRPGPAKEYSFHETALGASVIYSSFAVSSNESTPLTEVLKWISIHHTTDSPLNSFATAIAVQTKHFTDIGGEGPGADVGYHFIIDGNGAIYEGRPLGIKGSHVSKFNGGNVGVVLAGDFERSNEDTPTAAQLASLERLVDVVCARFGIRSVWWHLERNKQALTHTTECPGARLIPRLAPLRAKYPGPPP